MTIYTRSGAYERALQLVKAGLDSGAIKLTGPHIGDSNVRNIERDVEYLNGLIDGLTNNLTTEKI